MRSREFSSIQLLLEKNYMQRKVLSLVVFVVVCLLTLNACSQEEPRRLTTEEYILLNHESPLWLVAIDLADADLRGSALSNADLRSADLSNAILRGANLSGSILIYADLSGADLSNADLSGADLRGTNLSGAVLSNANLSKAEYNRATRWRADFDPAGAGAILIE